MRTKQTKRWYTPRKQKNSNAGASIAINNFVYEDVKFIFIFTKELIQNILDSRSHDRSGKKNPARVVLRIAKEGKGLSTGTIDKYINELDLYLKDTRPKYKKAKTDPAALIIEETNTVGLTGETTDSEYGLDKEDPEQRWNLFWHSEAQPGKTGTTALGRAGQGKITYHEASASGTVLALSNQENGQQDLLFGKCRFPGTFKFNSDWYLGYSFFCDTKGSSYDTETLPISDNLIISKFKADFNLTRSGSGTSWVIPHINTEIFTKDEIIRALIAQFYLAIVNGDLHVEIEGEKITSSSIRTLIKTYNVFADKTEADFCDWLLDSIQKPPTQYILADNWYTKGSRTADETCLDQTELDSAKKSYANGETLHFRVPLTIEKKGGPAITVFGDIYIRKNDTIATTEIYARDCLIINDEKHLKFAPGKHFGAFIAREDALNIFLGDADNPSHRKWNNKSFKLTTGYNHSEATLAKVRASMPAIARLLHDADQALYTDLFDDLISIPIKKDVKGIKKKKKKKKRITPPPRPPAYILFNISEGMKPDTIDITNGPDFVYQGATHSLEIMFGYETFMGAGDPFGNYHRFDFDLNNFSKSNFVCVGCNILSRDANQIELLVTQKDFKLSVTGFDPHECRVRINYT